MDTALVTGADNGIGLQIARQLVELGYRVYGLAANFGSGGWQHPDFQQITCDLSSTEHLKQAWAHIAQHDPQVDVVVHAYRAPVFAQGFEAAAEQDIAHVVNSGLLAPLLLTRWALPSLIRFRGYVINIGWNGEGTCPQGAAAAAVEGGLHHWTQSLFSELRDTGVKVCTVYPQRNSGAADPKARLKLEPQSEVDAKFVASAVAQILQFRENNLIAQLVVRPQGTREEPRIAPSVEPLLAGPKDIVLPDPDKRPPPPAPIPTPERRRPDDAWEFDDEDEDDEFEEDDELDVMLESSRRMLREQNENARRQLERTREKNRKHPDERGQQRRQEPQDKRHGGRGEQQRSGQRDAGRRDAGRQDSGREGDSGREHSEQSRPSEAQAQRAAPQRSEPATERPHSGDVQQPVRSDAEPVQAADTTFDNRRERSAEHGAGANAQERTDEGFGDSASSTEEGKRRRRRRRGGRGRNRNRDDAERSAEFDNGGRDTGRPAHREPQAATSASQKPAESAEGGHRDRNHRQSERKQERSDTAAQRLVQVEQSVRAERTVQVERPTRAATAAAGAEASVGRVTPAAGKNVAEKTAQSRGTKPAATRGERAGGRGEEKTLPAVKQSPVASAPTNAKADRTPSKAGQSARASDTATTSARSATAKPAEGSTAKAVSAAAGKPAVTEKPAAKKSVTKKPLDKGEVAGKAALTNPATKKTATKKAAVKKTATKKAAVKKVATRKTAVKKATGGAANKEPGAE